MSDLSFLVRGRGVDLVAMTASSTLRTTMGLGDEVIDLSRDELVCVREIRADQAQAWTEALAARQHWFNPNKHRFASYLSSDGGFEAVRGERAWPSPWLESLVDTDRPDLVAAREAGSEGDLLAGWMAPAQAADAFAVSFAVWHLEDGVGPLPSGHWPADGHEHLSGVLWTLVLRAASAEIARARAEEILVTRTRAQGMLVHPHMEGWTAVGAARPCDPALEVQT